MARSLYRSPRTGIRLVLGYWSFRGVWSLMLGASSKISVPEIFEVRSDAEVAAFYELNYFL